MTKFHIVGNHMSRLIYIVIFAVYFAVITAENE